LTQPICYVFLRKLSYILCMWGNNKSRSIIFYIKHKGKKKIFQNWDWDLAKIERGQSYLLVLICKLIGQISDCICGSPPQDHSISSREPLHSSSDAVGGFLIVGGGTSSSPRKLRSTEGLLIRAHFGRRSEGRVPRTTGRTPPVNIRSVHCDQI